MDFSSALKGHQGICTLSEHKFNDFEDLFNSCKRKKDTISAAQGWSKGISESNKKKNNNAETLPLCN